VSQPPQLDGVTHRDVDAGGVRLHVAEAGPADAPPLVLVHGWPQHWWCWHKVIPDLAGDFRCIAVDLRGHGWSEAPQDGYEKERLADDLLALLDAMEIERVTLAGHDWGGYIGFLIGLRAPERLSSLVAMGISHLWPSRRDRLDPRRLAAFAYQVPLSVPLGARLLIGQGLIRRALRPAARDAFTERDIELYEERMEGDRGARVTQALYRTFLLRELPALARGRYADSHLQVRTLLLTGERDMITRNSDLGGYESHSSDMRVEELAGTGHWLPEERPVEVAHRIRLLAAA
jgi:pimeloyl-ACP methyl ester carboxylesterase